MKKNLFILALISLSFASGVDARVLFDTEELDGVESTTFTINRENISNTTELIFGDTLGASLSFDSSTDRFVFSKSVDFDGNETKNLVLEQGTAFPSTATTGQVFYRTDLDQTFVYDGSSWSSGASSGGSNIIQFTTTLTNSASQTFTHASDPDFKRIMEVLSLESNTTLASPGWTVYDPLNYSNLDTSINDGNTGTIWYNNTSTNPMNKWIGFNAGSTVNVDKFTLYDYTPGNTYICNNMQFQSSNNGTTWTTDMTITGHTYSPSGVTYTLPSLATGQYFRLRCTAPANGSWWVLGELEIYEITGSPKWVRSSGVALELDSATQTTISNTGTDRDFRLNLILP